MNLKEKLQNLKSNLLEDDDTKYVSKKDILLEKKIEDFLTWYENDFLDYVYYKEDVKDNSLRLRKFIDKMAIWYELRYPDYEIEKKFNYNNFDKKSINDIMFKDNEYVDTLLDDKSFKDLDWDEFYNTHAFIKSLPSNEKDYLSKPSYFDTVYLYPKRSAYLHLTKNGYVSSSESFTAYTNGKVRDEELEGMHLKEVYSLLIQRGIKLPKDCEIAKLINAVDRRMYFKDELLNSIMYKIIERGGNIIGPRRGYLFAKEFNRNLDIPMMYAASAYDPKNVDFANQYLDDGGNSDLECYNNYFLRENKADLRLISVEDIINEREIARINYDELVYQREMSRKEKELEEIAIELEKIEKEKDFKAKRLERRLEKSRNRMSNY